MVAREELDRGKMKALAVIVLVLLAIGFEVGFWFLCATTGPPLPQMLVLHAVLLGLTGLSLLAAWAIDEIRS